MLQWQIGDVRVTRIVELESTGGSRFILPDATPEACLAIDWLAPHFMDERGRLHMSVHALVVDTGTRRVLVDTCIGNDKERSIPAWNALQTRFLEDLEAAGYAPETIDTVLCTHLHVDHVGWNTKRVGDRWVPTFPQARYLFSEREWAHWSTADEDDYGPVIDDSVRPVVDAGLVDLVADDHVLCEELRLRPTPGHTPGHVSVEITSKGERALITGDFVHHPCQLARTDWGSSADSDPAQARRTREDTLSDLADEPVLVIGTHFAAPTAGWVEAADGGGFRLRVE